MFAGHCLGLIYRRLRAQLCCMAARFCACSAPKGAATKPLLADLGDGFQYLRQHRSVLACRAFGLRPMFLAIFSKTPSFLLALLPFLLANAILCASLILIALTLLFYLRSSTLRNLDATINAKITHRASEPEAAGSQ